MTFCAITLEGRVLRLGVLPAVEALLRADTAAAGEPPDDAVFERVDLTHGRVALRVRDGRYLARHCEHPAATSAAGGDGGGLVLVTELSQCAAFEEVQLDDGFVSLRGCDLRFLGVLSSGSVVADRVANGSWERFRYLEVPAPRGSVPAQPVTPAAPAAYAPA